ncbi:type II 3-dehydroquinate dehydratase [Brevibacterium zhoupengii]|uniref:type II 3-dehydroquinate dehydratase n=1 Tax=Brevibacterium zhoupengii TaxID=2898795 RepID=UPI001E3B65D6|nr:type II 3-dehydroquinate dehydratase [Brevibacterium zhoupengii]
MKHISRLRAKGKKWNLALLSGPNTKRDIDSIEAFQTLLEDWGELFNVSIRHKQSNHEGHLLEFIHENASEIDGYIVNPGGLSTTGESLRHCLKDVKRPSVEFHWRNSELNGRSIFSPSVTAIFSGLGANGLKGAVVALALALDDVDFLNPDGSGEYNRSHGTPRSLYQ